MGTESPVGVGVRQERLSAMFGEAMSGAERIYKRAFPVKCGPFELIDTKLSELTDELLAELRGTTVLMRQRAAITRFLGKWEKACAVEARK